MLVHSSIEIATPDIAGRPPRRFDRVRVGQRTHVFYEGDEADALYQIVSGTVAIYRISSEGTRVIQGVRFAGETIGHSLGGVYGASALATQPCILHRIAREGEDPATVRQLAMATEAELARLSDQIMVLGSRSAIGSVAATLLDFSDRGSDGAPVVVLPLRRAELADLLALTIETVSRAMTRLRTIGAIEFLRPNVVRIRDRALLHQLAEGDGEGAARGRYAL